MGTNPNLWFEMKQKGKNIIQGINKQIINKKVVTGAALFSAALCVGVEPTTTSAAETGLGKVHHIYFDQKYVTTVNSLKLYDDIIAQEIDEMKTKTPGYEFVLGNDVHIVEETTFSSNINDEASAKLIEEASEIEAVTEQIIVNDKVVENLKTEADLKAAIKAFTAKYIIDEKDELKIKEFKAIIDK